MASSTVRDVLDRVRHVHSQVAERADQLQATAEKERVRLVLDYLKRHEEVMDECIAEYEKTADSKVLDSTYAYPPEMEPHPILDSFTVGQVSTADDVIENAVKLDAWLGEVYKGLAERGSSAEVRALFSRLKENSERETRRIVRDMVEVQDL